MGNGDHTQLSLLDLMAASGADAAISLEASATAAARLAAPDGAAPSPVLVEAARLKNECDARGRMVCGDISASYSADLMATKREGDTVRAPFTHQGRRYVCVGMVPNFSASAYLLITPEEFERQFGRRPAKPQPSGYHGFEVRHGGEEYLLAGPEMVFKAFDNAPVPFGNGGAGHSEDGAAMESADGRGAAAVAPHAVDEARWPHAKLIPAAEHVDCLLPKLPKKREVARRALIDFLEQVASRLVDDVDRYEELRECGAARLSRYDVEVAAGGNAEQALVTALSLKRQHVSNGYGLIRRVRRLIAAEYPPAFGPSDFDPTTTLKRRRDKESQSGASDARPAAHAIVSDALSCGADASARGWHDLLGVTVYRSGMSAKTDFLGYANAGVPVGVQVNDLSKPVIELLIDYNRRGGLLFLDTGAFKAFKDGSRVNFRQVMASYRELVRRLSNKSIVALVMPDIIGDQAATLGVLSLHRDVIREFIAEGCDVIVPIQKGALSLSEAYSRVLDILGTDQFRVALPSNKVAVTTEEALLFIGQSKPSRIHLLGIAQQKRFAGLISQIREARPGLDISSDANFLRAIVGRNRPLTLAIERRVRDEAVDVAADGDLSRTLPDETEFVHDLFNTPQYLSLQLARWLADLVSADPWTQARIIKAALAAAPGMSYGSRLGDLLEELCPGQVGESIVYSLLFEHAAKRIRRDIRGEEITKAARPVLPATARRAHDSEQRRLLKAS